jgi:glycosyltransferase involved in cell wall biosynthesis
MTRCEATIVIPTRDRWHILRSSALASALAQEDVDLEVVVVDDGSGDGTDERLRELGDPRVRVVRHHRPLGVARARNAGLEAARGSWVSFLDDDDLWAPQKLRRQLDAADAAGASFAYTAGAAVDARRRFLFAVRQPDAQTIDRALLRWNVIWCGCSNVAARADLLQRLGGFDERLFQLADWDLWIRLALASRAASCPDVLVAYTIHEQNMLLTDRRDVFAEFRYLLEKHRPVTETYGMEPDAARFTRWVAQGHRRAGRRRLAARTYASAFLRHGDHGAGLRAVGALLGKPGLMLGRLVGDRDPALVKLDVPEPAWLARYREPELGGVPA